MRRRDFLHTASQSLALGAIAPALACGAGMSGALSARVDRVDRRARLGRHAPILKLSSGYTGRVGEVIAMPLTVSRAAAGSVRALGARGLGRGGEGPWRGSGAL